MYTSILTVTALIALLLWLCEHLAHRKNRNLLKETYTILDRSQEVITDLCTKLEEMEAINEGLYQQCRRTQQKLNVLFLLHHRRN